MVRPPGTCPLNELRWRLGLNPHPEDLRVRHPIGRRETQEHSQEWLCHTSTRNGATVRRMAVPQMWVESAEIGRVLLWGFIESEK